MTLLINHLVGFGCADAGSTGNWSPQQLFTPGTSGGFYQIQDLATLFQERTGGGTTPAVLNGPVGTIRDKSGNGIHLSAPSDAARGILRQSGPYSYIEFDAVDDSYASAASLAWAYPCYTSVAIQKAGNIAATNTFGFFTSTLVYAGLTDSSATNRMFATNRNTTNGAVSAAGVSGSVVIQTDAVAEAYFAANAQSFWGSGNAAQVDTAVTFDPANMAGAVQIAVNRVPATGRRFYGGIFLLGRALSAGERASARAWLGAQMGLTL